MSRQLLVLPRAREDAYQIAEWIAADSIEQSDRFGRALLATYDAILYAPMAGRKGDGSHPKLKGLRWWSVSGFRTYLIFYRVTKARVVIVRIIHGHRHLPSALLED